MFVLVKDTPGEVYSFNKDINDKNLSEELTPFWNGRGSCVCVWEDTTPTYDRSRDQVSR